MSEKLKMWYDKEGDFLEIFIENKKGSFKAMGNDIFQRVDENGKPLGIAIFGFSKRFAKLHELQIKLPFELA